MISYTLIFIYFFTDPILCQDINSSGVAGTNDTMLSYATQSTQETQQTVVDPEIGERLKELKAISLSNPHQINERLNALNTLYVNDLVKVNDWSAKYEYWHHLYGEAINQPIRNPSFEKLLDKHVLNCLSHIKYYMSKIRITEAGIKKLNPSFVSPNSVKWYE